MCQSDKSRFAALGREIREKFFLPHGDNETLHQLAETTQLLSSPYLDIVETFRYNINSAITTAAFPYFLGHAHAFHRRFEKILIAERIRSLDQNYSNPSDQDNSSKEQTIYNRAREKFSRELYAEGSTEVLLESVYEFLMKEIDQEIALNANGELLNQFIVLIWSAFEILCRDMLETKINENPNLVDAIMADPHASKRFNVNRVSMDLLREHNFDLSQKMGTILVNQQDFSDLKTIKSCIVAISQNQKGIRDSLDNDVLWKLFQRRNLFVHRRGIVDKKYVLNTGENVEIGKRLSQNPKELDSMLECVVGVAIEVIHDVSEIS
jgi:hypothetical protein